VVKFCAAFHCAMAPGRVRLLGLDPGDTNGTPGKAEALARSQIAGFAWEEEIRGCWFELQPAKSWQMAREGLSFQAVGV